MRRTVHRGLRHLICTVCLVVAAILAGAPADAAAAPPGSNNFTAPAYVPNYFSNEAQSFQGNATARPAQPDATQPGAGPGLSAIPTPAPRRMVAAASHRIGRHHAARAANAGRRVRLARGKATTHRQIVHARVVQARVVHAGIVHAGAARSAARSAKASGPRMAHAQHGPARHGPAQHGPAQHGPAKSKAIAAKSRPASGRGKSTVRGRG